MKNLKIHDYNIYKYEINCHKKSITLYLKYDEQKNEYYKNIEFNDVLTHDFDNVMEGNIVLDLDILDFNDLFEDYEITKEMMSYLGNSNKRDEIVTSLKNDNYKCYEISSSYGLSGWIIAKKIICKD